MRKKIDLFFPWLEPICAPAKQAKAFYKNRWDIWIFKKLHSVHPTMGSDSGVCIMMWSHDSSCASYRGVRLRCVQHTAGLDSVVCITPQRQDNKISQKTQQCASHCRVRLRGMHHTEESNSTVCIIPRSQTPRCASLRGVKLRVVLHTVESVTYQASALQLL